jgi:zinc transport system permease protein
VTTAITVTVAMRAVGLLLVSALMVVPVATAQQVSRGFRATMAVAMALGLLASGGGVWLSAALNTGTGATVVLLAIAGFFIVSVGAAIWRRQRRGRVSPGGPTVLPEPVSAAEPEVVLDRSS